MHFFLKDGHLWLEVIRCEYQLVRNEEVIISFTVAQGRRLCNYYAKEQMAVDATCRNVSIKDFQEVTTKMTRSNNVLWLEYTLYWRNTKISIGSPSCALLDGS